MLSAQFLELPSAQARGGCGETKEVIVADYIARSILL